MRTLLTAAFALLATVTSSRDRATVLHDQVHNVVRQRAPRHVALLIGIGDYKALGDKPDATNGVSDLLGPANDVARMRTSLLRWGFTDTADVRVLRDAQATRDAMMRGFRWLGERADNPDDAVVVFFAGHGSAVPDENGDEADGLDEALVPWDAANFRVAAQVIIDDSIGVWLGRIVTHNVTVIVDACHSGTITRGTPPGRMRGLPTAIAGKVTDDIFDGAEKGLGHTLITAARSFETAEELPFPRSGDVYDGALTYHLTRILDGASATQGLRYRDLMVAVRQAVAAEGLSQLPQIEGDSVSPVFHSHLSLAARPFVPVLRQSGGQVTIAAGLVHGVRASTVYDIFPAGEMRFAGGRLARVRIDQVSDTSSVGRMITDGGDLASSATALPNGARAVLALAPLGSREVERLALYVAPSARGDQARIMAAIDTSRITTVRDSLHANAIVSRDRGILEVTADGALLPPQDSDRGPSVARAGETVFGFSDARLCKGLTRAFTIARFAALRNPAPRSDFHVYLRFVKAGLAPPYDTLASVADTITLGANGIAAADLEAYVSVPREALLVSTVYLAVATAGFISDPGAIWPAGPTPEAFPLNRWVKIWGNVPLSAPTGRETLVAVANTTPWTFNSLVQSADLCARMRAAPGEDPARAITGWTSTARTLVLLPSSR